MAFKSLALRHTDRRAWGISHARDVACFAILLLASFIFLYSNAHAQDRLLGIAQLDDTTDRISLAPYTLVQADPDNRVTPQSIAASNGTNLTGTVPQDDMIDLGYKGTPYWLTVRVQNTARTENWVVDLGKRSEGRLGYIQSARAYEMSFTEEGRAVLRESTALTDKGAFEFNIPSGTQKYILLHVIPSAGKPAVLPAKLYSDKAFIEHVGSYITPFFIHSMLLLGLAIFFLAGAITRREKSLYLFSAFFAYELAIWSITENSGARIGFDMFDILIPAMMLGFTLFSLALVKTFFRIEHGSFSERYILYGLAWLNIIASILAFLLPLSGGLTQISLLYGAPIITFSIICLMAFVQSLSGDKSKKYYFIGTLFPVIALIVIAAGFFDATPHNAFLINSLWYAVAVQGFFMILANHYKFSTQQIRSSSQTTDGGEIDFSRLRETRDNADHSRLLKVIEKERELLAELRARESERVDEMRQAKEDADEANRAKSAFLAVVSHEIRTPMTGVMGMVRLLLDSSITKQQRDYVFAIQESSEAMMALLNDILDFERIQRGKIELENISFDLHRLIQGVVTLMSGHAAEKGIELSARMDEDIPKYVKGDPTRLRQVLLNLMGNAIKFTKDGSVMLMVKDMNVSAQDSRSTDKYQIYFAVQDTGIGISAEGKRNLFTPFAQANSSITRKFGGTGLGLAISKGLVENMGSAININSKEGEGSTFFFTLEMARGIASSASEKTQSQEKDFSDTPVSPQRILVVDDNEITRKVIIGFLEQDKHEIITAASAEEALEKINQDAFDLVFMDIELPGMRGNEATRKLRDHPDRVKATIPVIAITGNIAREDRELYFTDGMNGFIPKPIEAEQLRAIVNEIAHESFEREIRLPEITAPDPFAMSAEDFSKQAQKAEDADTDASVFNTDMLQSLKDTIGAEQLNELLSELIVKTEEILLAISEASQRHDLQTVAARAHELKGMAGNFGLVEISTLAAQTERKAKTGDATGMNEIIGTFTQANERAQSALSEWSSR